MKEEELNEKYSNQRLDRLENHYKILSSKIDTLTDMVAKTSHTLLGSELEESGLIKIVNVHKKEINELKITVQRLSDYIKLLAWFSSVIGTAVIIFLVNYILK